MKPQAVAHIPSHISMYASHHSPANSATIELANKTEIKVCESLYMPVLAIRKQILPGFIETNFYHDTKACNVYLTRRLGDD